MKDLKSSGVGDVLDFQDWLVSEFTSRCKRNPRYSMRAFAKQLDMDPSSVSQLLSGKRNASKKMVKRITACVGTSDQVIEALLRHFDL